MTQKGLSGQDDSGGGSLSLPKADRLLELPLFYALIITFRSSFARSFFSDTVRSLIGEGQLCRLG